jgi:hypothetical protein
MILNYESKFLIKQIFKNKIKKIKKTIQNKINNN